MLPGNRAKFINLSDGTSIEDAIEALKGAMGGGAADSENAKLETVKALKKDSDLEAVVKAFNGLIADLKAKGYMA